MELDSHFFNDPIFEIKKQDFWVLQRSYFSEHEGTHTGWYKPFVEKLIKKDPKKYNFILKQCGFLDKEGNIDWPVYSVNGLGFRSDDWRSGKDGVIFLGCSDTFGIGNYLNKTAAAIVSNTLGVQNYNLGVPGGGLDQAYRVLKTNIADIKGKVVCLIVPEPNRRELFTDYRSVLLTPVSWDGATKAHLDGYFDSKVLEKVYFKLLCEKKYTFMETQKNIDGIKFLCKEFGKHLVILKNPVVYSDLSSNELKKLGTTDAYGLIKDLACDLVHRGPNYQNLVAKKLLEKL